MTGKGHNKKRNVGLIYEFLVGHVSRNIVEGVEDDKALKILRKFYRPGTEIYAEYRLFNSLMRTSVKSSHVAATIISEARSAARRFNISKLDREKSLLIREINHTFKDEDFYNSRIPEYKMFATVQTLLNDWRDTSRDADISRIAQYEDTVTEHILTERKDVDVSDIRDPVVDNLVVRVMTEKFNSRYDHVLNEEQKLIISKYALSSDDEVGISNLRSFLKDVMRSSLSEVSSYVVTCDDKILSDKLNEVSQLIGSLDVSKIDDEMIGRFLEVSRLRQEVMS